MERKYVMRRRVVFGAVALIGIIAAYYLVYHIWWTCNGWCWGDIY